jgi:signal transduction protein with GAF and PtsI domain
MPDEEEQYRAYRHVVEAFSGRPVVIRTFDVGGDKLPVGGYPTDANPFLGWRAIRMCLDEPELFKTQLRALLRAAMHGDVRIMFPLIITLDEVKQAKQLLKESAAELDATTFRSASWSKPLLPRCRLTRWSTMSRSSALERTISSSTHWRWIEGALPWRRASPPFTRPY